MESFECIRCSKTEFCDEIPRRGHICFKCHVKTIDFSFTHGKTDFHGPTIKERQDHQVKQAADAGIRAEPVGSRWV